jgi:ABC-2 type transport system ATP-binding protein
LLLFLILAISAVNAIDYQSKSEFISSRLAQHRELNFFGDELSVDLDSLTVANYALSGTDLKLTHGVTYGKYGVSEDCVFSEKRYDMNAAVKDFCIITDKKHVFRLASAFCGDQLIAGSKYNRCLLTVEDLGSIEDSASVYSRDLSTYLAALKEVEGLPTFVLWPLRTNGFDFDSSTIVKQDNLDADMTISETTNFASKYGFADCKDLNQINYYIAHPPDNICVMTNTNNVIELIRIINPLQIKTYYPDYKYAWRNLGSRDSMGTDATLVKPAPQIPLNETFNNGGEPKKYLGNFWYLFLLVIVVILILIIWEKVIRLRRTKDTVSEPKRKDKQVEVKEHLHESYEEAISVLGFTLKARGNTILENVSFKVRKGEMVCLLGPSGTGKSTVIESLVGRKTPTKGSLHVLGKDISKHEEVYDFVGFVPQHAELYMNQTVKQNLINSATKWGIKNVDESVDEVLHKIELEHRKDVKACQLSGGQQKLLSLGMELMRNIELCILDEPTTGLDPNTRNNIITILSNIAKHQRKTVFFTTHFMDDAEECDEVIIFADTRIVAQGSPTKLEKMLPGSGKIVNIILDDSSSELIKKIEHIEGVKKVIREGRNLRIITDNPNAVKLPQKIDELGGTVNEAKIDNATMMDVFVYHTGQKPDESN